MKYFWLYVVGFTIVLIACSYVVSMRESVNEDSFITNETNLTVPIELFIMKNMKIDDKESFIENNDVNNMLVEANKVFSQCGVKFESNGIFQNNIDANSLNTIVDSFDGTSKHQKYNTIKNNSDIPIHTENIPRVLFYTILDNEIESYHKTKDHTLIYISQYDTDTNTSRTIASIRASLLKTLGKILDDNSDLTKDSELTNEQIETMRNSAFSLISSSMQYKTVNVPDIRYHKTEEQIRNEENHRMNVFYVKGEHGLPIGISMESTQSFPTFYAPGSFVHSATSYVPTYKDAVILPLVKE